MGGWPDDPMSRDLTSAIQAELLKMKVRPIIFVEAVFTSGTLRVWSGIGTISWNGQTWTGVGNLGGISPISEGTEPHADGIELSLSGIPSDLVTKALGECRPNAPVKLWFGFLDEAEAVIAAPYQSFGGRADVPSVEEGGDTSTIKLRVENRLVDFNRARERRFTHEDQQIDYPGDLGFEYVAGLQEWNGAWGKSGGQPPNPLTRPSYPGGGGMGGRGGALR
jgi:hypothetical protein